MPDPNRRDPRIVAVASDVPPGGAPHAALPWASLDDIPAVADLALRLAAPVEAA